MNLIAIIKNLLGLQKKAIEVLGPETTVTIEPPVKKKKKKYYPKKKKAVQES